MFSEVLNTPNYERAGSQLGRQLVPFTGGNLAFLLQKQSPAYTKSSLPVLAFTNDEASLVQIYNP